MAKPISELLANMAVRAINTEDAVAAAQKETHDRVAARIALAQAAAEAAVQKVDQNIARTTAASQRPRSEPEPAAEERPVSNWLTRRLV
jgi:Ni,Fe-hydrogenase I large subunit